MGFGSHCYRLIVEENVAVRLNFDSVGTVGKLSVCDSEIGQVCVTDVDSLESGHVEGGEVEITGEGHIDIEDFAK